MRTVAAVLALIVCVHTGLWASLRTKETAPDFTGQLASVSYSPPTDPETKEPPTAEQIRADLKAIAPYTRAIRTYSATRGAELVPPIAAEFGLFLLCKPGTFETSASVMLRRRHGQE